MREFDTDAAPQTSDPIELLPESKRESVRRRVDKETAQEEEQGRQHPSSDAELTAHIDGRSVQIDRLFRELRDVIHAEESGHPPSTTGRSPEEIVAAILRLTRDKEAATRARSRAREWARTTAEIDAAYAEFSGLPVHPELPRLQAQERWLLLCVAAGVRKPGELRRIREQIADLS